MTETPMQIPPMSDQNKSGNPSLPSGVNPTLGISTNQPQNPVTDPAVIAQQAQQKAAEEASRKELATARQIQEQRNQIAQLSSAVQALVAEKNKPAVKTPDEAAKEFYRDPEKVIREVMRETVAPLNEFKSNFEAESAYTQLKRQYKADARYAPYFKRPGFEDMIDTVIREATKKNVGVTSQFVESAITHTVGQMATGTIVFPDPIADQSVNNQVPKFDAQTGKPLTGLTEHNQMIPPYLQPSSPPSPGPSQHAPQRRDLTENEDRIRREQRMSLEDWWKWQDMDSKDVISSKVGVPEPAEKK
jgi:hypothetical protein